MFAHYRPFCCIMFGVMKKTYTYWQDPKDGMWLGCWDEYPDYQTEGHTLEELRRMLISLRNDIAAMVADGTMECSRPQLVPAVPVFAM